MAEESSITAHEQLCKGLIKLSAGGWRLSYAFIKVSNIDIKFIADFFLAKLSLVILLLN
jgi:hypothetical protein